MRQLANAVGMLSFSCPPAPRWLVALMACAGLAATCPGAPKPLPDLSPEERTLRTLVQPLRAGFSDGPELQPLRDWLDARDAAGRGREAENDLRRVLKRITDDEHKDLLRAAEWVRTLQVQRSLLYRELSDGEISLSRAVEKSQDLAPLPEEIELLPGRAEISDAFLAGDSGSWRTEDPVASQSEDTAPETDPTESTDIDAPRLLDRLTIDLTILGHLLHQCDNDYEQEKQRHRNALDALKKFLEERRQKRASSAVKK
jgi:hypothetical protein